MYIEILNWLETIRPYTETIAAIGTLGLAIAAYLGLIIAYLAARDANKTGQKILKIYMRQVGIYEDETKSYWLRQLWKRLMH
jgi:hypothetical protein